MLKKTFFILFLLFIVACSEPIPQGELDNFATCLKDEGFEIYGSFKCPFCAKQREDFGTSFHILGEIECHPDGENSRTQYCLEQNIEKTPTWIQYKEGQEIQRLNGYQPLEKLAGASGCTL